MKSCMSRGNDPGTATPAFAALAVPIFRATWLASLVSNIGSLTQSVGASWMVASQTNSPTLVALVQASTALPFLLTSLLAGAIADNHDRRKVMLAAQLFMLLVSTFLALSTCLDLATPALLLSCTFLIGIGTALNAASWHTSVGDMVPRSALPGAVALNSMGFNIARSVGPAIGGIIVATAGAGAAFFVNAVSYLGLILVLLRWRSPQQHNTLPSEPLGRAMGVGLHYVLTSRDMKSILVRVALFGLGGSAVLALMPFIARDHVSGGAFVYGLLFGAFGFGAVIGALSNGHLRHHLASETIVCCATTATALGVIVTGLSHDVVLTTLALLVTGAGWVTALSTFNVTVQLTAPRWIVGRALAIYQATMFAGVALGSSAAGWLAGRYGISGALLLAGTAQIVGVIIGFVLPLPRTGALEAAVQVSSEEPPPIAAPAADREPIAVTVEYRIAPQLERRFPAELGVCHQRGFRDSARD